MSTLAEKIQAAVLAGQYLYPLQCEHLRAVELIKPAWMMEAETWVNEALPRLIQEAEARGEHEVDLGPNGTRAYACQAAGLRVREVVREMPIGADTHEWESYVVDWEQLPGSTLKVKTIKKTPEPPRAA